MTTTTLIRRREVGKKLEKSGRISWDVHVRRDSEGKETARSADTGRNTGTHTVRVYDEPLVTQWLKARAAL